MHKLCNSPARRMTMTALICCYMVSLTGCGTTKVKTATEQLLISNAVDMTIGKMDFSVIAGEPVFLDTQYITAVKGFGFVNANYIVSSIRQQLFAHGCQVQEAKDDATYIIEARVGALGSDSHDVTYGIPANNAITTAASIITSTPSLPAIPEISFAKRHGQSGVAKIAVFIYGKDEKEPVWQSGVEFARSTANDAWVFGAGPFQWGTIHEGTRFAGSRISIPIAEWFRPKSSKDEDEEIKIQDEFTFINPPEPHSQSVIPAGHTTEAPVDGEPGTLPENPDAKPIK